MLVAFEPGVQQVDAEELVARRGEARAFLIADYVFVVLYALVSPLAQRRYGTALGPSGLGRWLRWAPPLLLAAGVFDAIENSVLLGATDSPSGGAEGAAHVVAVPKTVLFVGATLLSLGVLARALRTLMSSDAQSARARRSELSAPLCPSGSYVGSVGGTPSLASCHGGHRDRHRVG